jgi:ribonuclease BN (tRNA processing enzyme)
VAVQLRCVGTGDAFGSGGRLHSCYHLQSDGLQLLLDCGCSSIAGLHGCGIKPNEIDLIVVSHLHGDHFGGIPFLFLEAKYISRRTRPLTLVGPPGLQQQIETTLEALYPGAIGKGVDFPVHYRQLEPESCLQLGDLKLRCFPVVHGSSAAVYGLRIEIANRVISYSGDTEWTDALLDLAAGSDLFIAECFAYGPATPSHLDYQTLLAKRKLLDCRRLVLTHLGETMLDRLEEVELEVLKDGDLLRL